MSDLDLRKRLPQQPVLQTGRLMLRPFDFDDAADVCSIVDNEAIASTTRSITLPYSVAMARTWIEPQAENWDLQTAAVYAVCWKPESEELPRSPVIGAVGLEICEEDGRAELGYWVSEALWNQGVATEAAGKLVEFGFKTLCLHKVTAFHMVCNPSSGRVLEKIGMSKEGVFREHVKKQNAHQDVVAYGILASDV